MNENILVHIFLPRHAAKTGAVVQGDKTSPWRSSAEQTDHCHTRKYECSNDVNIHRINQHSFTVVR